MKAALLTKFPQSLYVVPKGATIATNVNFADLDTHELYQKGEKKIMLFQPTPNIIINIYKLEADPVTPWEVSLCSK